MVEAAVSERAVVLLSGGLDSATVLSIARAKGREVHALSFAYGQRHAVELDCARALAGRAEVAAHEVVDLGPFGRLVAQATALCADSSTPVPDANEADAGTIPTTYVPARNTVFLAHALAWAEAIGAGEIWLGVNDVDYSGYPDCRPAYLDAFQAMAALATRDGVEGRPIRVRAPLLGMDKAAIIRAGVKLGVDYASTTSCYAPSEDEQGALACGRCESCAHRRRGFSAAGVPDPTRYADVR